MDLRNGNITLGEIMQNPKARAAVNREFPGILNHPFARRFYGMTLNQGIKMLQGKVPKQRIDAWLRELESI
ncbi:MAG: hypothetical protein VB100_02600 [Angelakisella sp.]|nr:hypothetical protein [Angelakisella sp.]